MKPHRTTLVLSVIALGLNANATNAQPLSHGGNTLMAIAAQSYLTVIDMLESTGYRVVDMKSTLLGRLKVRARNRQHMRELVISRSTGEVMSDRIIRVYAVDGDGESSQLRIGAKSTNSSTPNTNQSTSSLSVSGSSGSSSGSTSASATASAGGESGASASVTAKPSKTTSNGAGVGAKASVADKSVSIKIGD